MLTFKVFKFEEPPYTTESTALCSKLQLVKIHAPQKQGTQNCSIFQLHKMLVNILQLQTSRRQWQPTTVLFPGKSHGQRSLMGHSPWDCKELDITKLAPPYLPLHCEMNMNTATSILAGKYTKHIARLFITQGWILCTVLQT